MFPSSLQILYKVTVNDVFSVLWSKKSSSALSIDTLSFKLLKAIGEPIAKAISVITESYCSLGFFPKVFKTARTVVIRKPGKGSYEAPKA